MYEPTQRPRTTAATDAITQDGTEQAASNRHKTRASPLERPSYDRATSTVAPTHQGTYTHQVSRRSEEVKFPPFLAWVRTRDRAPHPVHHPVRAKTRYVLSPARTPPAHRIAARLQHPQKCAFPCDFPRPPAKSPPARGVRAASQRNFVRTLACMDRTRPPTPDALRADSGSADVAPTPGETPPSRANPAERGRNLASALVWAVARRPEMHGTVGADGARRESSSKRPNFVHRGPGAAPPVLPLDEQPPVHGTPPPGPASGATIREGRNRIGWGSRRRLRTDSCAGRRRLVPQWWDLAREVSTSK